MTEDEMVGWHHRLNGNEFGRTMGVGDGQGGLVRCIPLPPVSPKGAQDVKNKQTNKHRILAQDS